MLSSGAMQVHPLLPMGIISRFPWACGSGLSKARFAGFFHPSLAHEWVVPRLAERSIDVALLGRRVGWVVAQGAGKGAMGAEGALLAGG